MAPGRSCKPCKATSPLTRVQQVWAAEGAREGTSREPLPLAALKMDSSRADELVRQAEKKLSSFSFFGLKKAENYDSAAAMLEKAGTQYKLAKRCGYPALICVL